MKLMSAVWLQGLVLRFKQQSKHQDSYVQYGLSVMYGSLLFCGRVQAAEKGAEALLHSDSFISVMDALRLRLKL